jgi:hypothetical protein
VIAAAGAALGAASRCASGREAVGYLAWDRATRTRLHAHAAALFGDDVPWVRDLLPERPWRWLPPTADRAGRP